MQADDRELLIRIDTKLTVVCGQNGDGGVLAEYGKRLRDLEDDKNTKAGEHSIASIVAIFSGVTGFLTGVGGFLWAVLHGK